MDKDFFNFLKNAYTNGLCNEYRDEIRGCNGDRLALMRLAMRQQSIPFVATKMHEGVLTKRYIQKTFGEYLNGFVLHDCDDVKGYTYAMYLDYDYDNDLNIDVDVAHVAFTVGASVVVPLTKCPTIYISNRSNVHLVCEGYNNIRVYLFDKSKVTIEDCDDTCEILVYRYSDNCEIKKGRFCLSKKISDFRKRLKL